MGSFLGLGRRRDIYKSEVETPHPTKITEPSPTDFAAYPGQRGLTEEAQPFEGS